MNKRKLKKIAKYTMYGVMLCPGIAEANGLTKIAYQTFGPGRPGSVIIQLTLIAIISKLLEMISTAFQKGQISAMVSSSSILVCISMLALTGWKTLESILKFAGLM